MTKILMLFFLTTMVSARTPGPSFRRYASVSFPSETRLNFPYPMKLSSGQIVVKEVRRIIHFLKRAFVGVDANYTTGRSYGNYGPIVGIQFPSRIGMRVWGGMSQGRTMDLKRDHDMNEKMSGINGRRVGIGFKLSGDLSLDLEYQTINGQQNVKNNSYIMSLSAPLDL